MHPVKCTICNCVFDRDKIEFVKTSAKRYAHKSCSDQQQENLSEDLKMQINIHEYTKKLFKENYNRNRIELQLKKIMSENKGYTYSGVYKTLIYWYEVKHGDIEKSHYGLGIIPYVYESALQYYKSIWEAQMKNSLKNIEDFLPKQNTVKIKNPIRKPLKKERHFNILEEEDN